MNEADFIPDIFIHQDERINALIHSREMVELKMDQRVLPNLSNYQLTAYYLVLYGSPFVLLNYPTGSGKSLSLISAIFMSRNSYPYLKNKGVILVKNGTIKKQMIEEVKKIYGPYYKRNSTDKKYLDYTEDFTIGTIHNFINSIIDKETGDFKDRQKFLERYTNCIFCIDEPQLLRKLGSTDKASYDNMKLILDTLKGAGSTHIIFSTATIAMNSYLEAVSILNLGLPIDEKLSEDHLKMLYTISEIEAYFKPIISKYVSWIPRNEDSVKISYVTNPEYKDDVKMSHIVDPDNPNVSFDAYVVTMSDWQLKIYEQARDDERLGSKLNFNKTSTAGNFLTSSRMALIFAYPDIDTEGMSGENKGEKKYKYFFGTSAGSKKKHFKYSGEYDLEFSHDEFMDGVTMEDIIRDNLFLFSETFYKIINYIRDNEKKVIAIYTYFTWVGAETLGRCIEIALGIKKFGESRENSYVILNGELSSDVLNVMKSKDNVYGKHIRIIIITSSGSIGTNIFFVRSLFFVDPPWTQEAYKQILGRTIRGKYSHQHLKENERTLDVYNMCPVEAGTYPTDKNDRGNFINSFIYIYFLAKEKDIPIEIINNINRKYCIESQVGNRYDKIDNYNLYLIDKDKLAINNQIKSILKMSGKVENISSYLLDYDPSTVNLILLSMVMNGERVTNKYGFNGYVKEKNNICFITRDNIKNSTEFDVLSLLPMRNPLSISEITLNNSSSQEFIFNKYEVIKNREAAASTLERMIINGDTKGDFYDIFKNFIFTVNGELVHVLLSKSASTSNALISYHLTAPIKTTKKNIMSNSENTSPVRVLRNGKWETVYEKEIVYEINKIYDVMLNVTYSQYYEKYEVWGTIATDNSFRLIVPTSDIAFTAKGTVNLSKIDKGSEITSIKAKKAIKEYKLPTTENGLRDYFLERGLIFFK